MSDEHLEDGEEPHGPFTAARARLAEFSRLVSAAEPPRRLLVFGNCAREAQKLVNEGLLGFHDAIDRFQQIADVYDLYAEHGASVIDGIIGQIGEPPAVPRGPNGDGRDQHAQQEKQPKFLSKREFTASFERPEYLIDGILQRGFIYAITGQTGHAKTAIALRFAKLVAQMRQARLAGHEIEHGRVVYFVGENPDDVRMRVIGEDANNPQNAEADEIWFIPGIFNIDAMYAYLAGLFEGIGGVALVVVDTSAAYFPGTEELSNTQMGEYARKLRRLTTLPGRPCVLVLCHPVKHVTEPSQLLPRGGSAFLNELDGNLTAWLGAGDLVELSHGKLRGPSFEPISFKLERAIADRLVDSKGRQIPTIRAVPVSMSEQESVEDTARTDENVLLVARLGGPEVMSVADIARACSWFTGNGEPHKSKVFRVCESLGKERLLKRYRRSWVLTEAGTKAAQKAKAEADRLAAYQRRFPDF